MASIVGTPDQPAHVQPAPKKRSGSLAKREARWGYFFISPFLIGFFVFTFLPTLAALVMSFTNYTLGGINDMQFVGVQNYTTMVNDPQIWASLGVTVRYAVIALPVAILFPLGLAVLLNTGNLWGKHIFRTLFYFPYIVPFVAAIFVWGALLNPESGWINQFLRSIGIQDPPYWLNDTTWVYPALVILGIWGVGNAMLIFLASLQGVPTELYDASKIDGAGWWATMGNVTLPLISPVIFYNLTLAIVGLFQYFTVPLVVNQGTGAPAGTTMFYNLYLYKQFFVFQNMAYGAAMAWLLFVIVLAVTLLLFSTQKYWVYYTADNR